MKSELADEIFALIEERAHAQPVPMEFEFAYQGRVAIDRIRFAIKHMEKFGPRTDQMREVGLQLLNALQRLETIDRRFQARSRAWLATEITNPTGAGEVLDQHGSRPSNQGNGRDRT